MVIGVWHHQWFAVFAAALLAACAFGCGLAAAPQPPSLYLPKPVTDLKAERTGNQVLLTWTMPQQTTDNQRLKRPIPIRVCRQTASRVCDTVAGLQATPGTQASYTDILPPALQQGPLRSMIYQVFAQNAQGRATAASNDAATLSGAAPLPMMELTAQVVPQGVLLRWQPVPNLPDGTIFQIQRVLLKPPPKTNSARMSHPRKPETGVAPKPGKAATKKPVQPEKQTLLVHAKVASGGNALSAANATDPGAALDTSAQWNATYRYTVARVLEHPAGEIQVQLRGQPSQPVTVTTKDIFPPAVPRRLAAVVVSAAMTGVSPAVDLSWSANAEPDFSHYLVYRRNLASSAAAVLIAPAPGSPASAAVMTPAYRDSRVESGNRYAYSVSAVDANGNESAHSQEAIVDIPAD